VKITKMLRYRADLLKTSMVDQDARCLVPVDHDELLMLIKGFEMAEVLRSLPADCIPERRAMATSSLDLALAKNEVAE
jgi:hypothetical protein